MSVRIRLFELVQPNKLAKQIKLPLRMKISHSYKNDYIQKVERLNDRFLCKSCQI